MKRNKLNFFQPKEEKNLGQWLMEQGISAGFPSPADDFKEIRISLDRELVKMVMLLFMRKSVEIQ